VLDLRKLVRADEAGLERAAGVGVDDGVAKGEAFAGLEGRGEEDGDLGSGKWLA
jgi:hypothetical protein